MTRGFCLSCDPPKEVSNKSSHLAHFPGHHVVVLGVGGCGPGKPHCFVLKAVHLPQTSIDHVEKDGVEETTTSDRKKVAVGHVEMLYCISCGQIAHKGYAVYKHSPTGQLLDIVQVGPCVPPGTTTTGPLGLQQAAAVD